MYAQFINVRMDLEAYFSDDKIIKLLCKDRANAAKKRHEARMLRNLSLHAKTNRIFIKGTPLSTLVVDNKYLNLKKVGLFCFP